MSQDGSSSSSSGEEEDSVDNAPAATEPLQTERRSTRFQCPADFVSFSYKPCSSALSSSSSSTELWLIKAPANFDPKSFRGVQLPLRGLETVSVPSADGTERPYSVLGSSDRRPELRLFAPPSSLAPPFSGLISISESDGEPGAERGALHVIPAVPPPSLPPGLKQRFQHFGAAAVCTVRTQGETTTTTRRKRKKEKKIKSEPQEASESAEATPTELVIKTEIKPEPLDTGFGEQPEVKKKKKKKKSKSAE